MVGSQFPESMDSLANIVIGSLRALDGIEDIVVSEQRDRPTPWLTLEFTLFDFLVVTFFYDRGRGGFSVNSGGRTLPLAVPSNPLGLQSAHDVDSLIGDMLAEAKLRIPDKFLAARGWV